MEEPKFLCNTCNNCLRVGILGGWDKIYTWYCLLLNKNTEDIISKTVVECSKYTRKD